MPFTEAMIEEKLMNYNCLRERIALLEYEMTHPVILSSSDVLSALAFGTSPSGVTIRGAGNDFDRVAYLATHYRELAGKMSEEASKSVFQEWNSLMEEILRLERYISLLPEICQRILYAVYVEQKRWKEIEAETGLSRRTLVRKKKWELKA